MRCLDTRESLRQTFVLFMRYPGFLLACLLLACSSEAPKEGRTRLVIDTDLPTPEVASRLRIDLFRADGTWFDSRELDTSDPRSFPASFDLAAPEDGEVSVRVRLRVFPDGATRPYRGERWQDWPAVLGEPPPALEGEAPRLVVGGQDRTPETEPLPATAVDRLVTLSARSGESREVGVVLRGVCAGMMGDLTAQTSCVATERQREPSREPSDSVNKSLTDSLREPCGGLQVPPGRVCVPGGVFVLGDRGQPNITDKEGFLMDGRPERLVRVHRFLLDEQEISVGRYRALAQAGFKTSKYSPRDNDGPLSDNPASPTSCTFSKQPGDRENHPLNCFPWGSFRELCQHEKGDLPTEVQWEYAAALAGSSRERRYPWGDDEPACSRAVYARIGTVAEGYCTASPALVSLSDPAGDGDQTPLGLRGMVGWMSEFMQDGPAAYTDLAWTSALFEEPAIPNSVKTSDALDENQRFMLRGGSWASPANTLRAAFRFQGGGASPFYGARCAYPTP